MLRRLLSAPHVARRSAFLRCDSACAVPYAVATSYRYPTHMLATSRPKHRSEEAWAPDGKEGEKAVKLETLLSRLGVCTRARAQRWLRYHKVQVVERSCKDPSQTRLMQPHAKGRYPPSALRVGADKQPLKYIDPEYVVPCAGCECRLL